MRKDQAADRCYGLSYGSGFGRAMLSGCRLLFVP